MITFFIVMVDRTLIAEHHGLKVLASYGLAMVLLSPIQMIMTSVQTIWAPQLYSMPNMTKALKKSMKIMLISSVAMIIGVVLLSILIYISIIIGVINVNYKIVPTIIVLGSVGTIASSLMHLNSNMFVHLEKTTYLVFISLLVLIFKFGLEPNPNTFIFVLWCCNCSGCSKHNRFILGLPTIKESCKVKMKKSMNINPSLIIFANFRIDNEERYLRMKDSLLSF